LIDSPGSIVRSSISGCRPLDPGSNPGLGAKTLYFTLFLKISLELSLF
jgi:hypothetical protein